MASLFEKGFNKFADMGNALNKEANKLVGREVFGEIKKIEEPKVFPPFESYPPCTVEEPEQWTALTGNSKQFELDGNIINVSQELDTCFQYKDLFKQSAQYYANRFEFRYHQCVKDYDTLLHYFEDMYMEGLDPMLERAYSLFLVFGVFNVDKQTFYNYQLDTYNRAVTSYSTMLGITLEKKQSADSFGNKLGNSVRLQGGGFGLKGAAKGIAKAETFNFGMSALGKFVSHQLQMSDEEKAQIFSKFKEDVFFKEVYNDYLCTFFSMIQFLADNGILKQIYTKTGNEYNTMINNLKNPMFPKDKVGQLLADMISKYPFAQAEYELLINVYGENDETREIINYFNFPLS